MSTRAPVLFLVRGLPGSGKTTRALALAAEIDAGHASADDYFVDEDGVYRFDPRDLPDAHAECQDKARKFLIHGLPVIVHNTFTQGWEATPYVEMARKAGAEIEVINLFDGDLSDEELAARNVHGVPLAGIIAMRGRWEADLLAAQAAEPRAPWERG